MILQVLKCKLKDVIVTEANTEYEGSLTLDPLLMEAAHINEWERVEVNAKNGDGRIVTYVIPGERGSGQVEMNGGAANFFNVGDHVHVNCYAFIELNYKSIPKPRIVVTKEFNQVIEIR